LLLRERQELRRETATGIAIERHEVRDKEGVEDPKQQQRIFRRLSQRFRLLDQQACPLRSRPGFGGVIAFDMHECGDERDLKLNLLALQSVGACAMNWAQWFDIAAAFSSVAPFVSSESQPDAGRLNLSVLGPFCGTTAAWYAKY
jgi:hypothetical protein